MKRFIKICLIMVLFLPIFIFAKNYDDASNYAKDTFHKNFTAPDRYLIIGRGSLIGSDEVRKSMVTNSPTSSYLFDGTKYWANDKYLVSNKYPFNRITTNISYPFKVTELVQHKTRVKGNGRYSTPWIFVDQYNVTVTAVNARGTITSLLSNSQEGGTSVVQTVSEGATAKFKITAADEFKYMSNNCGADAEYNSDTEELAIKNISKDMSCEVTFTQASGARQLPLPHQVVESKIVGTKDRIFTQGAVPSTFIVSKGVGYFRDLELNVRVGILNTIPSRKGWNFYGYKVDGVTFLNGNGVFDVAVTENFNKNSKIDFSIEPKKYDVTLSPNGGEYKPEVGTKVIKDVKYEHDVPDVINKELPFRKGYLLLGFNDSTGKQVLKYDPDQDKAVSASNIWIPEDKNIDVKAQSISAQWQVCPKGYYCPGDNEKHQCPKGYTTKTTGAKTCKECYYTDPCWKGELKCQYGCDECACFHTTCWTGDFWSSSCEPRPTVCPCNCSSCHHKVNTCTTKDIYLQDENSCSTNSDIYYVKLEQGSPKTKGTESYQLTYYEGKAVAALDNNNADPKIVLPTREGYVFDGYYTKQDGKGTKVITTAYEYASNYSASAVSGKINEINKYITNVYGSIIVLDLKGIATLSGTRFTLYAHWTPCEKGSKCPGDNKSWYCEKGQYQDQTGQKSCKTCIADSYTPVEGLLKCAACTDGVKNGANGSSGCGTDCPNKTSSVTAWETAKWSTNNTVSNVCKIKSCKTGYTLKNNACVANKFTVAYYANGGSGSTASTECTYDSDCKLSSNSFTRSGYSFTGWKKDNSGDTLAVGTNIKNIVTSGTVKYYAQWKATFTSKELSFVSGCGVQEFTVPSTGKYKIELWGAQGSGGGFNCYVPFAQTYNNAGGKGGYTKGEINLNEGTKLYFYVGGSPSEDYENRALIDPFITLPGGCNGGGSGSSGWEPMAGSGGGATDVRYGGTALKNRIMVAGGGGGAAGGCDDVDFAGGAGGNTTGGSGVSSYGRCMGKDCPGAGGGTQSAGGTSAFSDGKGSLGQGANGARGGPGGGGGYYGGGRGYWYAGAGGGSSYISGYSGCTKHSSGKIFSNTEMQSGIQTGNGKAIITLVN